MEIDGFAQLYYGIVVRVYLIPGLVIETVRRACRGDGVVAVGRVGMAWESGIEESAKERSEGASGSGKGGIAYRR